jgi:hypothetical protein
MSEREDYTDDSAAHGRASPLLTVLLCAAIGIAGVLAGYLVMVAIQTVFGGLPK